MRRHVHIRLRVRCGRFGRCRSVMMVAIGHWARMRITDWRHGILRRPGHHGTGRCGWVHRLLGRLRSRYRGVRGNRYRYRMSILRRNTIRHWRRAKGYGGRCLRRRATVDHRGSWMSRTLGRARRSECGGNGARRRAVSRRLKRRWRYWVVRRVMLTWRHGIERWRILRWRGKWTLNVRCLGVCKHTRRSIPTCRIISTWDHSSDLRWWEIDQVAGTIVVNEMRWRRRVICDTSVLHHRRGRQWHAWVVIGTRRRRIVSFRNIAVDFLHVARFRRRLMT
jgi:hypothetical protein